MSVGRVKLKRVAEVRYGLGQPPKISDDGIPIIRATNINRGFISSQGLIFAKIEDIPLDRAPLLRAGEILVVRSGAYTGDSAIVPGEWAGSAPGYDLRISPGRMIYPSFLAYYLQSSPALHQVEIAKNRAAQPHLNAEDLGDFVLDLPMLNEQRRIADYLNFETDRIDCIVALRKEQIDILNARSESLIESCVDATHRNARVKAVVSRITSGPRGWGEFAADAGSLFLRIANISGNGIDLDLSDSLYVDAPVGAERDRTRTEVGDVLVSITADIGSVGVVDSMAAGANVSQHIALLRPNLAVCNPRWLAYSISAPWAREYLRLLGYGGTKMGLGLQDVSSLPIPLPALSQQNKIVRRIDHLLRMQEEARNKVRRQLELLTERRQALITAAVTGQIDVSTARGVDVS